MKEKLVNCEIGRKLFKFRIINVNDNSKRKRNDTNIFLTKKVKSKSAIRNNCIDISSLCNMEIVENLTLRKR